MCVYSWDSVVFGIGDWVGIGSGRELWDGGMEYPILYILVTGRRRRDIDTVLFIIYRSIDRGIDWRYDSSMIILIKHIMPAS